MKLSRLIFTITASFLLTGSLLHAQIPRTFSYQGVMTDGSGEPISNGSHTIAISLYETPSGGSALYTEMQSVMTGEGIFSMVIGSSTAIPQSIDFNESYWLGISVDGGAEMTPRTPLTSVPYALSAGRALTAETAEALAPGATGVVTSINGQSGALTLQGGGGTTVTQNGSTIMISSTGGTGGTGIQGVQNTDGILGILNSTGPVATINLNDGSITGAKIADGTIQSGDIADNTITSAKIANGTIENDDLAGNAVTSPKIASGAIDNDKLANAGVTSNKIADGAVATDDIADGAVASAKIGDGAVTTAKIGDGAVTTAKIGDETVTSAKIADGGVATADLADDAVTSTKIADGGVVAADLADDAVTSAKIAAGGVATADLADDAVTSAKIAAGGVQNGDLADNSVTGTRIADNAVTETKIADNAVSTGKIAAGAVTLAKISNTGAANGKVLEYNGTAVVWGTDDGLTLPVTTTVNTSSDVLNITNTGSGHVLYANSDDVTTTNSAVYAKSKGAGPTVYITKAGTSGVNAALSVQSSAGVTIFGRQDGAASQAGVFRIYNATNGSASLEVSTAGPGIATYSLNTGTGRAGNFTISNANSTADALYATTNGAGNAIYSAGNAYKTVGGNTWTIPSDARLKENVLPFTDGLNLIGRIRPVRYHYNGLAGTQKEREEYGVIAQEIGAIAPYTVEERTVAIDPNDPAKGTMEILTYNSGPLTYVMINAIRELNAKVDAMTATVPNASQPTHDVDAGRIEKLREENRVLRQEMEAMRGQLQQIMTLLGK